MKCDFFLILIEIQSMQGAEPLRGMELQEKETQKN